MDMFYKTKQRALEKHGDSIRLLKNWRDFFWAAYHDEKIKCPLKAKTYKEASVHYDNALAILELDIEAPSMENLIPVNYGENGEITKMSSVK